MTEGLILLLFVAWMISAYMVFFKVHDEDPEGRCTCDECTANRGEDKN